MSNFQMQQFDQKDSRGEAAPRPTNFVVRRLDMLGPWEGKVVNSKKFTDMII